MDQSFTVTGNQVKMALTGKIYAHEAGDIRDALIEKIEQGAINVHMDLSRVTYIDSSGLGVLVTVHKHTKALDGRLTLTGVQGLVKELFERTRLSKILIIEQ